MLTDSELKKLHGKDYIATFETKHQISRLIRLIPLMSLTQSQHVIDFACGSGMLQSLIYDKVLTYTGVDFSNDFIKMANLRISVKNSTNTRFVCADINQFSEKNQNMFDAGFAFDFSEHVYDKKWVILLRSMRKSLKSGGRFYLHTPNADYFMEKLRYKNIILKQFPQHVAVRNVNQNKQLLLSAGFVIKSIIMLPHYNILRFLHPLSKIPFIGRYFQARIFIEAIAP